MNARLFLILTMFMTINGLHLPFTPAGEAKTNPTAPPARTVPVVVHQVQKLDIPRSIETFGRVIPMANVSVQAQVSAKLLQVQVADGQRVKAGDLMFVLDEEPSRIAVEKAQAQLDHDNAQMDYADAEDARNYKLMQQGAVTKEIYDSAHASYLAAVATRDLSVAALEDAKLQYSYCRITAPLDGAIGRVAIKAGNLITANTQELTSINSLTPARVTFFVSESRLSEVRQAEADGTAVVRAYPKDGSGKTAQGTLAFIDNEVDSATGAITVEGEFPNDDLALWPGQYVRVTLTVAIDKDQVIAPEEALHPTTDGTYLAAVVKGTNGFEMRKCKVSRHYEGFALVTEGLAEGDQVILDGYLRLAPGSAISITRGNDSSQNGNSQQGTKP